MCVTTLRCSFCDNVIKKKYNENLNFSHDLAIYLCYKDFLKHTLKEHSHAITGEEIESIKDVKHMLLKKVILWFLFDVFVRLPLFILLAPLFILKIILDWLFENPLSIFFT